MKGVIMKSSLFVKVLPFIVLLTGIAAAQDPAAGLPDLSNVSRYITIRAPLSLLRYDSTLASSWDRCMFQSAARRQELGREIDKAGRRMSVLKTVLLVIGSSAGLANTIYSGIEANPRKGVVVPLGAISGTALLTLIPGQGREQAETLLKQKIAIEAAEKEALDKINTLENTLIKRAILVEKKDESKQAELDEITLKVTEQKRDLRESLTKLIQLSN
jgi:hypothetical protein